jgi:hypothetical protein
MRIGDQHDIASAAAVTAVGAAARHVLLAPEGDTTRSAVAAAHVDDRLVYQHR